MTTKAPSKKQSEYIEGFEALKAQGVYNEYIVIDKITRHRCPREETALFPGRELFQGHFYRVSDLHHEGAMEKTILDAVESYIKTKRRFPQW